METSARNVFHGKVVAVREGAVNDEIELKEIIRLFAELKKGPQGPFAVNFPWIVSRSASVKMRFLSAEKKAIVDMESDSYWRTGV